MIPYVFRSRVQLSTSLKLNLNTSNYKTNAATGKLSTWLNYNDNWPNENQI